MTADIRAAAVQAREALDEALTYIGSAAWSPSMERDCRRAIAALDAALAAPAPQPSDYVLVRLHRPEGYEDVHPDLILQDATIHPAFEPEIVETPALQDGPGDAQMLDARRWRWWRKNPLMRLNRFDNRWRITTADAVLTNWYATPDEAVDAAIQQEGEQ